MIRWKKGDYIKLGRAVSEFNKEIKKHESLEDKLSLPEQIDYKELRDNIQTREGLNAYIASLKRIKLPGSFNIVKLENGEQITEYEKKELDYGREAAIIDVSNEVLKEELQTKSNYGFKPHERLPDGFKSEKQNRLERKLEDYKKLYTLTGKDFEKRAREVGINRTELQYRRAYVFRKNYMEVMKKYKDLKHYDLFKKWANKHKDPVRFYNALPDTEYYPDDLYYQSDKVFTEEQFDGFLESLGIEIPDDKKEDKKEG